MSQRRLGGLLLASVGAPAVVSTTVSVLAPEIRADLEVSLTVVGGFALVLFSSTAIVSLGWGVIADRTRAVVGLIGTQVFLIAALCLVAVADDPAWLLLAAIPGGVALAAVAPFTNRIVAELGDPRRRGALIATKQAGVPLTQMVVAVAAPLLAAAWGWRVAPIALILIPLAIIVAVLVGQRSSARRTSPEAGSGGAAAATATVEFFPMRHPRALIAVMCTYAALTGILFQAVVFGAPVFMHDVFGFGVEAAASTLVVLGGVGLVARALFGIMIDRRANPRRTLLLLAALSTLGMGALGASALARMPWAAWIGIGLQAFAGAVVLIVVSAALLAHYPLARIGSLSALIAVCTFLGFAVGPLAFGTVVDSAGFAPAWLLLAAVSAVAGVVVLPTAPWRMASEPTHEPTPSAPSSSPASALTG